MKILSYFIASAVIMTVFIADIKAQEETEWVVGEFARTRLVTSHKAFGEGDSPLYVGWEIELKKGWKTYWRSPGDAGKPTLFDFQGSINVSEISVFHPAPERFELFGIQTFGYEKHLILPILIKPKNTGEPLDIKVAANFMVCKDICVLLDESYSLTIDWSDDGAMEGKYLVPITDSVRAVPTSKKNFLDRLTLGAVKVYGVPGNQMLSINVKGYNHLAGADVIVEAGKAFHFGTPKKALKGKGKEISFVVPVGFMGGDGYKPKSMVDLKGERIILTLMDGWGNAIERTITVSK
jgi:suppressor for copper-sensitivity B